MSSKKHVNQGDQAESTQVPRLLPLPEGFSLEQIMDNVRREVENLSLSNGRADTDAAKASRFQRLGQGKSVSDQRPVRDTALGLTEILRRLHDELERRRTESNSAKPSRSELATGAGSAGKLPRWITSVARLNKPEYALQELLQYSDADFVDTAYLTLLRRPADVAGREQFLSALRNGHLDKVEVLGKIRFSEEGRRQSVHVDGLLIPYKLHQWRRARGIGRVLAFVMALVRLPRMVMHLQMLENAVGMHSQGLGRLINRIDDAVEMRLSELDTQIEAVRKDMLRTMEERGAALESLSSRVNSLQMISMVINKEFRANREQLEAREHLVNELLESQRHAVKAMADELQKHRAEIAASSVESARNIGAIANRIETQALSLIELGRQLDAVVRHEGELQQRMSSHEELVSRINSELLAYKADHDQNKDVLKSRMDAQEESAKVLEGKLTLNAKIIDDLSERVATFFARVRKVAADMDVDFIEDSNQQESAALNKTYLSFEDRFRGERAEIKARSAIYLDVLKDADIDPGKGVVLDLGCGRGEWLEVLRENGYQCRGVDLNDSMLAESRTRGFDVVEADALDYLSGLEDGSLAAITSMHLVEHLPHKVLIKLVDEVMRVLQPGGMLILETPNPENLTVGAFWFYVDPTHRHPIPPDLLQWAVQERGFSQVVIRRLAEHRRGSDIRPVSEDVPGAEQINLMAAWFISPPDYAVIARKP